MTQKKKLQLLSLPSQPNYSLYRCRYHPIGFDVSVQKAPSPSEESAIEVEPA